MLARKGGKPRKIELGLHKKSLDAAKSALKRLLIIVQTSFELLMEFYAFYRESRDAVRFSNPVGQAVMQWN